MLSRTTLPHDIGGSARVVRGVTVRGGSRLHGRPWAESPLWERRLAVLLCHSHCASRGAAIPQSSLGRCCFTIAIALRAVLLCYSHCALRCAATPQSSHHAVLLCHSHRFARCWCSTDTALRAVLLCYATVIYSVARCWVSPLASVIAWCGAGSSIAGAGG